MRKITWLLIACVLIILFLLFKEKISFNGDSGSNGTENISLIEDDKPELLPYMHSLQILVNKTYYAGKNGNKELLDFYVHEFEEVLEEIAAAGIVEDGIRISESAENIGLNSVELFEESINEEGFRDFESAYSLLINGCNSCHTATRHEFIKIITPSSPVFSNQDYTPTSN